MKIHKHENNPESQSHLTGNKEKFSAQCLKVLELLRQGKRLTTMSAPGYGILSLPRRIKDLRDHNGVENIVDEWDKVAGVKVWYMNFKTDAAKKGKVNRDIAMFPELEFGE